MIDDKTGGRPYFLWENSTSSDSLRRCDYLIFYRFIDSGVEILRVIHGARDIEDILDNVDETD